MNHLLRMGMLPVAAAVLRAQAPVDSIRLFGNGSTRDRTVLAELRVQPGKPAPPAMLEADRRWLERLGWFRTVDVVSVPDSSGAGCTVLVAVKEKNRWRLDPVLSEDDLFGWTAGATVTRRNLFGRGQDFSVGFRAGGVDQASVEWTLPWAAAGLRGFAEVRGRASSMPYPFTDYKPEFREHSAELEIAGGVTVGRRIRIGACAAAERVRTDDPAATLSGTGEDRWTSLGAFGKVDSRDRIDYPRRGGSAEAAVRLAQTPAAARFVRSSVDLRRFVPVAGMSCLALQAAGEWLNGDVPVYKRLHLGGSKTLRGYPNGWIAGENACRFSAEMRFPVWLESGLLGTGLSGWFGVLFADAAAVWFGKEWPDGAQNRFSAGFGAHALWDGIVLRAECGWRTNGGLFYTSSTGVKL
jgi:outer membrane protein assembly factor BamA